MALFNHLNLFCVHTFHPQQHSRRGGSPAASLRPFHAVALWLPKCARSPTLSHILPRPAAFFGLALDRLRALPLSLVVALLFPRSCVHCPFIRLGRHGCAAADRPAVAGALPHLRVLASRISCVRLLLVFFVFFLRGWITRAIAAVEVKLRLLCNQTQAQASGIASTRCGGAGSCIFAPTTGLQPPNDRRQ